MEVFSILTYSIELNAENIYHPRTKEYFSEVLQSFINGSNRSAVVMLYSVVMSDLVYKLQELKNRYEDETAIDILEEILKMQETNPRSSQWESYLIDEVIKRTSLLDTSAQINLEHLRQQRHLSAHPVLDQENLLVKPNKETVRALIRNTLESILTKNPILTRNVLGLLLLDMKENKNSFITDNLLKKYLDSKYLKNLNDTIMNILFKDLWNITFSCSSDKCVNNRDINVRVLNILYHKDKPSNQSYIKDNKAEFKINQEQEILLKLTEFIGDNPEVYNFLEEHETLELNEKIRGNVQLALRSPFIHEDMETHFKELRKLLTNRDDALTLEYQLNEKELVLLKKWANINGSLNEYYRLLIELFTNSMSFDSADKNYKIYIQKNLEEFNTDHFKHLFQGINSNRQCYARFLKKQDNTEIKNHADRLLGTEFNYSKKYPNVEFY